MGVKRKSRKGRKFHYPSITDNLPKLNDGGKVKTYTHTEVKQLTDELNKYNETYNILKEDSDFTELLDSVKFRKALIPRYEKGSKEYYETLKEYRETSPDSVHPSIDPDFIFPRYEHPLGTSSLYTTRPKEEIVNLEKKTYTPEYPQQNIEKVPTVNVPYEKTNYGTRSGFNVSSKTPTTNFRNETTLKEIFELPKMKYGGVVKDPATGLPKLKYKKHR